MNPKIQIRSSNNENIPLEIKNEFSDNRLDDTKPIETEPSIEEQEAPPTSRFHQIIMEYNMSVKSGIQNVGSSKSLMQSHMSGSDDLMLKNSQS